MGCAHGLYQIDLPGPAQTVSQRRSEGEKRDRLLDRRETPPCLPAKFKPPITSAETDKEKLRQIIRNVMSRSFVEGFCGLLDAQREARRLRHWRRTVGSHRPRKLHHHGALICDRQRAIVFYSTLTKEACCVCLSILPSRCRQNPCVLNTASVDKLG